MRQNLWLRAWRRLPQTIILTMLALIFVAPLVWLFDIALKTLPELGIYPIRWLPVQAQWQNFSVAFQRIDYVHYLSNTVSLASLYAVLTTFSSALVGFGFSRLRAPGKQALFLVMLSTLMLPPIITLIPVYLIDSKLGLANTYWPWILWGLASSPAMTFLFRQFFAGIPKELEEAAIIDGAGYFRIFWQIFLPLSVPVLVTVLILSFTFVWGDWLASKLLLDDTSTTLGVAISRSYLDETNRTLYNLLAAGTFLYIAPVLVLFLAAQRYYVRGMTTSGLK